MVLLSLQGLSRSIPDYDQVLLTRRIRQWSDNGILKHENGLRQRRRNNRRYRVEESFYVAMAVELMDAGLNPVLLPQTAVIIRDGMKKNPDFARQWNLAKQGDRTVYLIVRGKPLPSGNLGVEATIREDDQERRVRQLLEATRAVPHPEGMVIDLTAAFSRVRVPTESASGL